MSEDAEEFVEWFQRDYGGPASQALTIYRAAIRNVAAERDRLQKRVEELEEQRIAALRWADDLAETLMAVNSQHGGRNAARLLKEYRVARAALQDDGGRDE